MSVKKITNYLKKLIKMEIETQLYITNLLKTNPKIVENNLNYNDKKFNKKKNITNLKNILTCF